VVSAHAECGNLYIRFSKLTERNAIAGILGHRSISLKFAPGANSRISEDRCRLAARG
jgi:hypothetical protein